MGQTQHVIIVGAGMGGLAAAIRLAHAGVRVTVLEAMGHVGGKMRTLPSAAGPVDAGPTVLTLRDVFEDLFAAAGARLDDHLRLVAQPVLARHWWPDGSTLDLFADPQASAEAISVFAGSRAAQEFQRFDRATRALFSTFDVPMMRAPVPRAGQIAAAAARAPETWGALMPGRALDTYLRNSFTDPRLRQLFGRYATYVGGDPSAAPAVLALVWQAEARGVWVVEGGMARLAATLADLATMGGADLRLNTPVSHIVRHHGRACGVALCDGTEIAADAVVFNGDPAALYTGLLGQEARGAVAARAVDPRSLSAWVWAFGATPTGPRAADLLHHNVFFGPDPAAEFGPIARGAMPEAPTLYVCAQDRGADDTHHAGRGASPERFEIIMNAPPMDPGADRKEGPCRTHTFTTLTKMGLSFAPIPAPRPTAPEALIPGAIAPEALTAPPDFAAMFPASKGSLYGRSPHGLMAAFARPTARTRLAGLYLAGGGAHPGAGVPMATLSGRHAAEAILTDLALPLTSLQTATRGGISMGSRTAAPAPSR